MSKSFISQGEKANIVQKKLQVFISSTYIDLKEERQAAVEAILSAGHIPAGMELFSAGNESQLETIKRWISESDVFMLILGGRYGSIEPKENKSYINLEYEYALQNDIPLFSIVMSEQNLKSKVRENGEIVLELENQAKYRQFKQLVLSKTCDFFDDLKNIKVSILKTLKDFEHRYNLSGRVSCKDPQYSRINKKDELFYKVNYEWNLLNITEIKYINSLIRRKKIDKQKENVISNFIEWFLRTHRVMPEELLLEKETEDNYNYLHLGSFKILSIAKSYNDTLNEVDVEIISEILAKWGVSWRINKLGNENLGNGLSAFFD